jgi:hypothetical protein
MILCEWDTPEGHPGQYCVHLYAFVFYRRLSSLFQFSLFAVTLVYLSQWFKSLFAQAFQPGLVLVSAGFDATAGHPAALGGYSVSPACFGLMTTSLLQAVGGKVSMRKEFSKEESRKKCKRKTSVITLSIRLFLNIWS